ncbi:MAG: biotin/lipoyl-containing protein, partial [Oscillospiraceae bacterium]
MKINIVMPKMGESVNEGTLIKWHKKKGDRVKKDEIIFEISTDKVDTEIPSPEAGILIDIKVFEQETVEVDTVVAVIETENEAAETEEVIPEPEIQTTNQIGGGLIDIVMPKMGESVMEGTIIKWHKKAGDFVKEDEILFEISTDKVDTEIPSPIEGTITEILFEELATVEVGTVVARISSKSGIVVSGKAEKPAEVVKKTISEESYINEKKEIPESNKFFSPMVLKIAREQIISFDELENIAGTGDDGRVSKKDLLKSIEDKKTGKINDMSQIDESKLMYISETEISEPDKKDRGIKIIPMNNIRKRIMFHMVNSRDTSVHVTAVTEVNMSRIYNHIQKKKTEFQQKEGIKLTYMPFVAYSTIKALKEYPLLNSSIDDNGIRMKNFINLGIAVAVEPDGLIVPNIKDDDEKSISGLAKEIGCLRLR